MKRYVGIGKMRGKTVSENEALAYAMEACGLKASTGIEVDPEFRKALIDWFYSGDWMEVADNELPL